MLPRSVPVVAGQTLAAPRVPVLALGPVLVPVPGLPVPAAAVAALVLAVLAESAVAAAARVASVCNLINLNCGINIDIACVIIRARWRIGCRRRG